MNTWVLVPALVLCAVTSAFSVPPAVVADATRTIAMTSVFNRPLDIRDTVSRSDALLTSRRTPARPAASASVSRAGLRSLHEACFIENRGQIIDAAGNPRADILYTAEVQGVKLYFMGSGVSTVYSNHETKVENHVSEATGIMPETMLSNLSTETSGVTTRRVDMTLSGHNTDVSVEAGSRLSGAVNYYFPHCPRGITGVPRFNRITYRDVYDRIDLEYVISDGRLKYNFIVHPGGDVKDIRMRYHGADLIRINGDGSLQVTTELGGVKEDAPLSYQLSHHNYDAASQPIPSRFIHRDRDIGFSVDEYDATQTLIIDPWASYIGGSNVDYGMDLAIDGSGNMVVLCNTGSSNFPVTNSSTYQGTGVGEVWLGKVSSSGAVVWATFFGGSSRDDPTDLALDGSGNPVVQGRTGSVDLPVTNSTTLHGVYDSYLAKFNGSTGSVLWASYFGGSESEDSRGIAVDGNGNIWIAVWTSSPDIPVTNSTSLSDTDLCLARFDSNGGLQFAGYFGGSDDDGQWGDLTVDGNGNVLLTGSTGSTDLPVTNTTTLSGTLDAFAAKFSANGSLSWCTFLGGGNQDYGSAISTDGGGNLIIAGTAKSSNFPVTNSSSYAGLNDVFLVKFSSTGSVLWCTLLGGTGDDDVQNVAVSSTGAVYVAGESKSANFPVTNSSTLKGVSDGFVAAYSSGGGMQWCCLYGGLSIDRAGGIAVDGMGSIDVCGTTTSTDFPVTNNSTRNGPQDAFIMQLDANGAIPVDLASFSAVATDGLVTLAWSTESEANTHGFEIQRRVDGAQWEARSYVRAQGFSVSRCDYSFTDDVAEITAASMQYRLRIIDFDGSVNFSPVVDVVLGEDRPALTISFLHPQPIAKSAWLGLAVTTSQPIAVTLQDALGREVRSVWSERQLDAGIHALPLSFDGVSAGVYFLRVIAPQVVLVRRIVVGS